MIGHGHRRRAVTRSGGFHRSDNPMTERHQEDEDAKDEALVPGTGEPSSGVMLTCVLLLLNGHNYREVAGRLPQGGRGARFPRASSELRCLTIILMGIADSSSVCDDRARMDRQGIPVQPITGL